MPKSIMKLRDGDCRYIVRDDKPKLYCAEPVWHPATSFCKEHHLRCYQTGRRPVASPIFLPVDRLEPPKEEPAEHHPDLLEVMK